MAGRRDEVKQGVDSIVTETGVTLYTRLFSENIIILTFKVGHDFLETTNEKNESRAKRVRRGILPVLIVNVVSETGSVDYCKGDTNSILLEF